MFFGKLIEEHGANNAADKAIDAEVGDIAKKGMGGGNKECIEWIAMRSIIGMAFMEIENFQRQVKALKADLAEAEKELQK